MKLRKKNIHFRCKEILKKLNENLQENLKIMSE